MPLILVAVGIGMSPAVMRAQQCVPRQYPAFEFEVDAPARAIPDSTHPHPAANPFAASKDDPDAIIIQFVVDTAGMPIAQSFKALKAPSRAVVDSVKSVMPLWRFTPSRQGACKVLQLVQTTVVR